MGCPRHRTSFAPQDCAAAGSYTPPAFHPQPTEMKMLPGSPRLCSTFPWLGSPEAVETLLPQRSVTFSRSGSSKPSANSLLSITEEAATSNGVDPLIDGEAKEGGEEKGKETGTEKPPKGEQRCRAYKWTAEGSKHIGT